MSAATAPTVHLPTPPIPAEPAPLLAVADLAFAYGAVTAVDGVSLSARRGEITCVMGRNGVGKTTLMRSIMGVLRASAGTVTLDGADIGRMPAHRRARAGIALVPQGREIFAKLTVAENLRIGLEARRDRSRRVPDDVLDTFPVLRAMAGRMGGDLSGGQQQQLAIARALVGDPSVLLLDEPTEGIQPNIIQEIGEVLVRLARERRMAIILVEQYLDFVKTFGTRFHIMNRGRIVASGLTSELHQSLITEHLSV